MAGTRSTLSAAGALLLLASCAMAGASPSPIPAASQPVSPTAVPPAPTATAQPIPTATALATDQEQTEPPLGELVLPDGSAIPGYQGTWCYDSACADIIPPDKEDLPRVDISVGLELSFALAQTHPFAYWTVDYSPEPDDGSTTRLAEGGTYVDPDVVPATSAPELLTFTFAAPPAGDWALAVNLQFAGGLGDAVYYWPAAVE